MSHIPRIRAVEIHITYKCNLRCSHCHNLASVAPSNEEMTFDDIRNFVEESTQLSYPWEWIVLHGGEPSLHSDLDRICRLLQSYKLTVNPGVNLKITTNGFGDGNREKVAIAERHGFEIHDSKKDGSLIDVQHHTQVLSSPTDLGEEFNLGCFQSSECGICLTKRGYYECSPAGAAWRLMRYEPMATRLADVTEERLAEGFKIHCKHCGYARFKDRNFTFNPTAPISPTWANAIRDYTARLK